MHVEHIALMDTPHVFICLTFLDQLDQTVPKSRLEQHTQQHTHTVAGQRGAINASY